MKNRKFQDSRGALSLNTLRSGEVQRYKRRLKEEEISHKITRRNEERYRLLYQAERKARLEERDRRLEAEANLDRAYEIIEEYEAWEEVGRP